jgi:hypothetical protein
MLTAVLIEHLTICLAICCTEWVIADVLQKNGQSVQFNETSDNVVDHLPVKNLQAKTGRTKHRVLQLINSPLVTTTQSIRTNL